MEPSQNSDMLNFFSWIISSVSFHSVSAAT